MREFKKGDIVKIAKTSRFYGKHKDNNPAEIEGRIIEVYSGSDVRVQWPNATNTYTNTDLELVNKEPIINNSYDIY